MTTMNTSNVFNKISQLPDSKSAMRIAIQQHMGNKSVETLLEAFALTNRKLKPRIKDLAQQTQPNPQTPPPVSPPKPLPNRH